MADDASNVTPIAGFDGAAWLAAFQAAAHGGAAKSASNFFPEDATCSVCEMNPLYTHTANLACCCGTAMCRTCANMTLSSPHASRTDLAPGAAVAWACPFCEAPWPTTFTFASQLLQENAAKGEAWAKFELATATWPEQKQRPEESADAAVVTGTSSSAATAKPLTTTRTPFLTSEGERQKHLEEAAAEGLASAQVALALEQHLVGPYRTAPSPDHMEGMRSS
jgi:hypothetical protein